MARYRAVSDGDLRRAGLSGALRDPGTPEDLADHLCLSHTVWTARNEWRLPGVEEKCAGNAMRFCAATMATRCAGRRSPGPGC